MLVGVLLAIASGMMPAMNLGLAFVADYVRLAKAHGSPQAFTALALFVPLSIASFFSSSIYYAFLWKKNGTLAQFRGPHMLRYSLACLLIAAVWFPAMILYGWAMPWMKSYGPVIGWPVWLTVQLLSSAAVEYFYGDWRGRALRTLSFALAALTISVALFAYANLVVQRTI
jgi:hypothetical protein